MKLNPIVRILVVMSLTILVTLFVLYAGEESSRLDLSPLVFLLDVEGIRAAQ